MRARHAPLVAISASDRNNILRQNIIARHASRTTVRWARETMLCGLERQRLNALARDDMAAVALCEDGIVHHERALAEAAVADARRSG